jgi:SAM-dependent methyltransferase
MVRPVCPLCQGELDWAEATIACTRCGAAFRYENGTPDLVRGGRFDDDDDPARTEYEVLTNVNLTQNYWLPVFRRMFPEPSSARLLSLGCGVGVDIDMLAEAGFDIVGIDCGNRSRDWPKRTHRDRLFLANGKHLPFEDGWFDLVYCGCVFPHVGVVGDSNRVAPNYREERLGIAREMTRVLRPGGRVLVSSPNRWFPLDLFHGRDPSQPYPRWNPPTSPFLLSAGDYRRLFGQAGCNRFQPMPVKGYWGFLRMKRHWKGKLMAWPVETVFDVVSRDAFAWLRPSPINPWLVMLGEKA